MPNPKYHKYLVPLSFNSCSIQDGIIIDNIKVPLSFNSKPSRIMLNLLFYKVDIHGTDVFLSLVAVAYSRRRYLLIRCHSPLEL